MAINPINVGTNPNDKTGDKLRDGFIKINASFVEVTSTTSNLRTQITNFPSSFMGNISLSSATPTLSGIYVPTQSGTYTNFGGIVIDLTAGYNTITYNSAVTGSTAYAKQVVPINLSTYDALYNNFSNLKYTNRTNKRIYYDPATLKLKVIGNQAPINTADNVVLTFTYSGQIYTIQAPSNDEFLLGVVGSAGHTQIGISAIQSDYDNIPLSAFTVFNDASIHAGFIKLAHLVWNDGLTSDVILDYRKIQPTYLKPFIYDNLNFNSTIRHRKRKWIAYDRSDKTLKIVGSDTANTSDEICVTIYNNNITYIIKGFVGVSQLTTVVAGNSQVLLSKTIADPSNVYMSDFEYYNDSTDRSATHIKLAHITYNDALDSQIIIDYQDYQNTQITTRKLSDPASAVNNSVGEVNFAHKIDTKLRILGFGNSFMRNSIHHLSNIAASGIGVNLIIGDLYTGGTNLSDHLAAMNSGSSPYEWYKYVNGVMTESLYGQTAAFGLESERWDAIILHQYTPWTEPFQPNLNLVMKKIVSILGYCPKFYLNSTWAGHQDYVLAQYGFATELDMWGYMLTATTDACSTSGIIPYSLIPTGTAIQNARTLSLANSFNRFTNAGTDWHHLNSAGGFIAACTLYQKIIAPLNKINCSATTFRINTPQPMPPAGNNDAGIVVTDSNYLLFTKSAIDAVNSPNVITNQ